MTSEQDDREKVLQLFNDWQQSPILFIEDVWGLKPERDNAKFVKGKHITWQQHDFFLAVEAALRGEAPRRISARSGHGTGKDTDLAFLIIWYLSCFPDAQVPCTAPTTEQMFDVLWKEISIWLNHPNILPWIKDRIEWQASHVRMKESPETWFARAKTARKENPEALAGVHGEYVLEVADEASGVPDEIFRTGEGALTGPNFLQVMMSNPTRIRGYFYDSHHKDAQNFQTLHFNSEESPIVDKEYVQRILLKHGRDSDEYKIRVLGEFPKEDAVDDAGYVPLLNESDLKYCEEMAFVGPMRMGIDPSGEGSNKTQWVIRDNYKAKRVLTEETSNPKTIAQKTLVLLTMFKIPDREIFVDNFGVGANVSQELAMSGHYISAVNGGTVDDTLDPAYLNYRAFGYYEAKEWIRSGGELVQDKGWEELLWIRFTRNLRDKIQIMDKQRMRREGYPSPDLADAFSLTFYSGKRINAPSVSQKKDIQEPFDPHSIV